MSQSATSTRFLNSSRDGDSTTSLGSLFQCLMTLSVKKFFLISNLNLSWSNLRPFPLVPSLAAVESDEVSPQPPFLQAKQPQVPQPLPISLVLQTLPQLRCPSLDTLQPLNVSLGARGPTLNTAFEVRPHQCPVQGTITALLLLATLFLIQARMLLAFLATWAPCWLMFSRLSTNTPSFLHIHRKAHSQAAWEASKGLVWMAHAFAVEQKEFQGLVPAQRGSPLAAAVGDICLTRLPSTPSGNSGTVSLIPTPLPSTLNCHQAIGLLLGPSGEAIQCEDLTEKIAGGYSKGKELSTDLSM
ncbi:hypothetical protein QYF61_021625 [Mycteria americana]|uniref:Uncharacterized protein n=1 Tax=Mycteria americana TaxID=33587 RepID=A0AAN7MYL2_MYCAM|nr:hypothetical protein QYF61_021625 [Mycteria americana]